jgi:hypothetical protein
MAYALAFANTAIEDLNRLVDSLPSSRQDEAVDEIERVVLAFADRPVHRRGRTGSPPSFPIHFRASGTLYYWTGTYRLSEDETTLIITHLFRTGL